MKGRAHPFPFAALYLHRYVRLVFQSAMSKAKRCQMNAMPDVNVQNRPRIGIACFFKTKACFFQMLKLCMIDKLIEKVHLSGFFGTVALFTHF